MFPTSDSEDDEELSYFFFYFSAFGGLSPFNFLAYSCFWSAPTRRLNENRGGLLAAFADPGALGISLGSAGFPLEDDLVNLSRNAWKLGNLFISYDF